MKSLVFLFIREIASSGWVSVRAKRVLTLLDQRLLAMTEGRHTKTVAWATVSVTRLVVSFYSDHEFVTDFLILHLGCSIIRRTPM
jgi:hypothetical protein